MKQQSSSWLWALLILTFLSVGCFDDDDPPEDTTSSLPDLSSEPEDTFVTPLDEGSPAEDVPEPLTDLTPEPEDTFVPSFDEGSPVEDVPEPLADLIPEPEDTFVPSFDEGSPVEDVPEPLADLMPEPEDTFVPPFDEGPIPECFEDADCLTAAGCNEPMVCDDTGSCVPMPLYATYTTYSVGSDLLTSGMMMLNGVNVGPSESVQVTWIHKADPTSAIAKAAAINKIADLSGVRAHALPTVYTSPSSIPAGEFPWSSLMINGMGLVGLTVQANDADHSLRNAINAYTHQSGVFATVDNNYRLVLVAEDGRNITLGGTHLSNLGIAAQTIYAGLQLRSEYAISVTGSEPSACGFPAGYTAVSPIPAGCFDGDPCTEDVCVPETGLCQNTYHPYCSGEPIVACEDDTDCLTEEGCNDPKVCGPTGLCEPGPFYATMDTNNVTTEHLAAGDLIINEQIIGASNASLDTLSVSHQGGSAITKAALINQHINVTGVTAHTRPTAIYDTMAVAAGHFSSGEFIINGVDIGAVTVLANDADSSLRLAINAQTPLTGVVATLMAPSSLVLRAPDGRNITISGIGPAAIGIVGIPTGTKTGGLILTSRQAFDLGGANPGLAGFWTNQANVNTAFKAPCIDLSHCVPQMCHEASGECVSSATNYCAIPTLQECESDLDCDTGEGCANPMVCGIDGVCIQGPSYAWLNTLNVTIESYETGDVVINDVAIEPSLASDDLISHSFNEVSAIAKAAAINKSTELSGVKATILISGIEDLQPIYAGLSAPGDIYINGVELGATLFLDDDADHSLRDAINSLSDLSGVFAMLSPSKRLILFNPSGGNIELTGTDTTITGSLGFAVGLTPNGLVLSTDWAEGLSITGTNPNAIGFPSDGAESQSVGHPMPCFDGDYCTDDKCEQFTGICTNEPNENPKCIGAP